MANKNPFFLEKYWERDANIEKTGLEDYWSKQLHKSLYRIRTTNLSHYDREQLKQIAKPVIREVNKRLRLLEDAGLTSSPAYRFLISELGKYPTVSGSDINTIRNNIRVASDFLHTKTSLVENAKDYNRWLDEHLGVGLTEEEKVELWDVIHRFETTHPNLFINYGYDEAIRKISSAYHLTGKNMEQATATFYSYLENEGILANLEKGQGQELRPTGIRPWWGKRKDFMSE